MTPDEVSTLIQDMRYRLDELETAAKKIIPQKDWYTRSEFAKKKGITRQTVSNYLYQGKFGSNQRKKGGRWQIHKSELNQ